VTSRSEFLTTNDKQPAGVESSAPRADTGGGADTGRDTLVGSKRDRSRLGSADAADSALDTGPFVCVVTKHDNGLGNNYFDCAPIGTMNLTQATAAANAWGTSGATSAQCGDSLCVGRTVGSKCALWCYSGPLAGYVAVALSWDGVCTGACPSTAGNAWN
jgi:hypothetical protein